MKPIEMTGQARMSPMHEGGWPRVYPYASLYRRVREAWWVLTGQWSLHRAWQAGLDQGSIGEWRRIIVNGGDLHPIMRSVAEVTFRHCGVASPFDGIHEVIARGWQEYRENCLPKAACGSSAQRASEQHAREPK